LAVDEPGHGGGVDHELKHFAWIVWDKAKRGRLLSPSRGRVPKLIQVVSRARPLCTSNAELVGSKRQITEARWLDDCQVGQGALHDEAWISGEALVAGSGVPNGGVHQD
jgi:hypothetical protein